MGWVLANTRTSFVPSLRSSSLPPLAHRCAWRTWLGRARSGLGASTGTLGRQSARRSRRSTSSASACTATVAGPRGACSRIPGRRSPSTRRCWRWLLNFASRRPSLRPPRLPSPHRNPSLPPSTSLPPRPFRLLPPSHPRSFPTTPGSPLAAPSHPTPTGCPPPASR